MNVLFSSINSIYRTVQQPPTDLKICRGIYLFSAYQKAFSYGRRGTAKRWMRSCFEFRTPHPSAFGCPLPSPGKAIQFYR